MRLETVRAIVPVGCVAAPELRRVKRFFDAAGHFSSHLFRQKLRDADVRRNRSGTLP